jgi:hypothetical protein
MGRDNVLSDLEEAVIVTRLAWLGKQGFPIVRVSLFRASLCLHGLDLIPHEIHCPHYS